MSNMEKMDNKFSLVEKGLGTLEKVVGFFFKDGYINY